MPNSQTTEFTAKLASVIREEIVRQYRDDDRAKWPGGPHDYEEHQGPWLIAKIVEEFYDV